MNSIMCNHKSIKAYHVKTLILFKLKETKRFRAALMHKVKLDKVIPLWLLIKNN